MANNKVYMVPIDHPDIDKVMPSKELLELVIRGRQRSIQRFDFSEIEKRYEEKGQELLEYYRV